MSIPLRRGSVTGCGSAAGSARSRRLPDGVELRLGDAVERFDGVVLATHADQALALLEDPTPDERRVLGGFAYTANEAILHTDSSYLPRRRGPAPPGTTASGTTAGRRSRTT